MSHLFGVGLQVEVNKINNGFRMTLAKRGRVNAHTIGAVFRELDTNGNGSLDPAEFEKGLAKFGLFPSIVQLQSLFKYFDLNQDGNISYEELLRAIREPLTGRRLEVVERAFASLDHHNHGFVRIEDLFEAFNVSQSEDFLSGKHTKEDLFASFGFAVISNKGVVSREDFINLYTDISQGIQNHDYFFNMVEHTWNIVSDLSGDVTKDHLKGLVTTIRQKLLATSNRQSDEYVLRTIYSEFDTQKDGHLTADMLGQILLKLQIRCDKAFLAELIKQLDRKKTGAIEFEEFVHFIIYNPYK